MEEMPRILVMDDERGSREALWEFLHPVYQVTTAESGAAAL
jgi:CheY-like chemotaxis protein